MRGFSQVAELRGAKVRDVYKYKYLIEREGLFETDEKGRRHVMVKDAAELIGRLEDPSLLRLKDVAEEVGLTYSQCYQRKNVISGYRVGKKYLPTCVDVMREHIRNGGGKKKKLNTRKRYRTIRVTRPVADYIRVQGSKVINKILLESSEPDVVMERSDPVGRVSVHLTFSEKLSEKLEGQNACGYIDKVIRSCLDI